VLAALAATTATAGAAALAQSAPPPAAEGDTLGEIVVTAEKVASTEQRTPIAMTVLTPEVLARNAVGSLQDLASIAPSVSFSQADGNQIITVRGVSSRDTTEIGDPAVAVNIDGLYFQRSIGLGDSVFDLERVEVLRGPQGTLYGRNATGGAINFVTAKPKKEFEAAAAISIGNYQAISTEGMVNIPLSDRVQVRVAGFTRRHSGYSHNAPARDGDDADSQAARIHLAVQPTENFSALFTAELVKLGGVGPAIKGVPLVTDENGDIVHDRPAGLTSDHSRFPLNEPSGYLDSRSTAFRVHLEYQTSWADFTYVGGYRRLDFKNLLDLDGVATTYLAFQQNEKPRTSNHEIRISSKPGAAFQWQAGAFYFDEKNDLLTYFQNNQTQPAANLFTFTYPDIDAKSKAVFGQGSIPVVDNVKIELGARYSKDEKKRVGNLNYGSGILYQDAASTSSKTTYHAAVNWQVTPANLLYVKYDTGYKAGGFTDAAPYDPESISAIEAGSKNRFHDDKVQVNVAAFHYDYKDQQISQFVGNQTFIRNAGKSRLYGLEIDAAALVTPDDRLDAYLGYLNAKFTDFSISAGSGNVQLSGNAPPQAPKSTINLGYQHTFRLSGGGLTARVQSHYESESFMTFFNYPDDRQPSYTRSDAMLTWTPTDAKWDVQAYVRNIEDKRVLSTASEQPLFGTYVFQFGDPRTYGVRFSARW
jgi:iron complex outermembrane receptor protein